MKHVKVRVHTSAKKEELEMLSSDTFRVSVKEPREENKANVRVVQLIAQHFGIPASQVRIVHGHRAPNKILELI